MDERSLKARRLRAIQQQLCQIEQWKLADLERQVAELECQQQDLLAALSDADLLQDLFLDARARRLRRLVEQITELSSQQQLQARQLLQQSGRARVAASLSRRAEQDAWRVAERQDLHRLIDDFFARGRQASGKIAAS
jgi:hypothetical protein